MLRVFGALLLFATLAAGAGLSALGVAPLREAGVALDWPAYQPGAAAPAPAPAAEKAAKKATPSAAWMAAERKKIRAELEAEVAATAARAAPKTAVAAASAAPAKPDPAREAALRREIERKLRREYDQEFAARLAQQEQRAAAAATATAPTAAAAASVTVSQAALRRRSAGRDGALAEALASVDAALCGGGTGGAEPAAGIAAIGARYRGFIRGSFANRSAFPWVASVTVVETPADQFGDGAVDYRCAGAVIARDAVATSAHCLANRRIEGIEITLGAADLRDARAVTVEADRAICHRGFSSGTRGVAHDVAVIPLKTPLPSSVATLNIAAPQAMQVPPEAPIWTVGWGPELFAAGGRLDPASQILKSNELRLRGLGGGRLAAAAPYPEFDKGCLADSGGPLVRGAGAEAALIGLGSYDVARGRPRCRNRRGEGVFTDMSFYRNWVEDVRAVCAARGDC